MKPFTIEATKTTPRVVLDKNSGLFEISGNSSPTNSEKFYHPIIEWLKNYAEDPNLASQLVFKLEYFNSSSTKYILNILTTLEFQDDISVRWYFKEGDDEMEEAGEEFAAMVDIEFDIQSYKDTV